jgi:hypothetical protein
MNEELDLGNGSPVTGLVRKLKRPLPIVVILTGLVTHTALLGGGISHAFCTVCAGSGAPSRPAEGH